MTVLAMHSAVESVAEREMTGPCTVVGFASDLGFEKPSAKQLR